MGPGWAVGSSLRGACPLWPGVGAGAMRAHGRPRHLSCASIFLCAVWPGPESQLYAVTPRALASFGLHGCCALRWHPAVAPAPTLQEARARTTACSP